MQIKAKEPAPIRDEPEEFHVETTVDAEVTEGDNTLASGKVKKLTTMKIIVWVCLLNGIA